jgi:diaminopimelate epimerase
MFKNFVKYHSLGNDLVLFDLYAEQPDLIDNAVHGDTWRRFVIHLCDRHYGVGADGVLIVAYNTTARMPEMLVFNADGSQAENCLNGMRCVADYLYSRHVFQERFSVKVGARTVLCEIHPSAKSCVGREIVMRVRAPIYGQVQSCSVPGGTFTGHIVSVGNPHFVVFERTTVEWLATHGKTIESLDLFPDKTNVEFVWKSASEDQQLEYTMLVYERGCGITLACSTGATAVVGLLASQNQIAPLQRVTIKMPGGPLCAWVETDGQIALQADARAVFKGVLE